MMHIVDAEWIEKCKANPEKYKIEVDNDSIFVINIENGEDEWEVEHDFEEYGYYFAKSLLEYIGCNVDFV